MRNSNLLLSLIIRSNQSNIVSFSNVDKYLNKLSEAKQVCRNEWKVLDIYVLLLALYSLQGVMKPKALLKFVLDQILMSLIMLLHAGASVCGECKRAGCVNDSAGL